MSSRSVCVAFWLQGTNITSLSVYACYVFYQVQMLMFHALSISLGYYMGMCIAAPEKNLGYIHQVSLSIFGLSIFPPSSQILSFCRSDSALWCLYLRHEWHLECSFIRANGVNIICTDVFNENIYYRLYLLHKYTFAVWVSAMDYQKDTFSRYFVSSSQTGLENL